MSHGPQRGKCSPVLDFPVGVKHQVTVWLFFAHAFMRCSRPAPYCAWMQSVKSQIRAPEPWLIVEARLVKGSAQCLTLAIHPDLFGWILTMFSSSSLQIAPGWVSDIAEPRGELRTARCGAHPAGHPQYGPLLWCVPGELGHPSQEAVIWGNVGGQCSFAFVCIYV